MSSRKDLSRELSDRGLDVAEDAVFGVLEAVFSWLKVSALASRSVYGYILLAVLPLIKPLIYKLVDKIDGEVDDR